MRILFLTKYGRRAASTRYRFCQFFPLLERAGIEYELSPLLSDEYLATLLDRNRLSAREVARGVLARLALMRRARSFDLVVLYMEALPYLPATFEWLMTRLGIPFVYDFDDACFHQYDQHRSRLVRTLLGRKIGVVIARATLVIAGNEYLAAYARCHNAKVTVVPTVVDTGRYLPTPRRVGDSVVVGWIGSPSTAAYVAERKAVLDRLIRETGCVVRIVGGGPRAPTGPGYEAVPWRENREVEDVQGFDIGVMPLRDDPWSRGKCGFKLIQYMACGLPVVASPVGVNPRIVTHECSGFLCDGDEAWLDALRRLILDASLRARMGEQARRAAVRDWSLQRWGETWITLLRGANGR